MVDIHDRRERPDFADGTSAFSMPTLDKSHARRWKGTPPTPAAKRDVRQAYTGLKQTQTWQEANRLASRRTRRSGGPWDDSTTTQNYALAYEQNLINVLANKGPKIAKKYGEITPGR